MRTKKAKIEKRKESEKSDENIQNETDLVNIKRRDIPISDFGLIRTLRVIDRSIIQLIR